MGNFSHEAIDIDPSTGIAYLTEDDFRGSIPANPLDEDVLSRRSFLYRYVPTDPSPQPGALQAGGTLQVLCLEDLDGYNADLANPGQSFGVLWKDVNPANPHDDAYVKGGVRFNRLEGCHFSGGAFWFDDTAGGEGRHGQVFRLIPAPGGDLLELFFEGATSAQADAPDNLIVTPWGDLWFAEDGGGTDRVMGVTALGGVYEFARNRLNATEFAGPCFSPDGKTFFVNIQEPPITFAIRGRFPRASRSRQQHMAAAAPPRALAPHVSGELAEAAERHGMTRLEAAAYDRLGVPLT
jgi:secreted PhoX family phosphatase